MSSRDDEKGFYVFMTLAAIATIIGLLVSWRWAGVLVAATLGWSALASLYGIVRSEQDKPTGGNGMPADPGAVRRGK